MTITTATSSPSSSTTTTTSNPNPNSNSSPTQTWWESLSRARSCVLSLSPLVPSLPLETLTLISESDRPAQSLLSSPSALLQISLRLSSPLSGSGDDPLCCWLYDTFLSPDPDLRLLVLSLLPLVSHLYLSRVVAVDSATSPNLAGFEAVLLAVYSSETKLRSGKPQLVSVPDLSQPSLYHSPRPQRGSIPHSHPTPPAGILSPPLEPQLAVKSTKRACIVAVALESYFKKISLMPAQSKIDFCRSVVSWAGQDCKCRYEFDNDGEEIGNCEEEVVKRGNRIPLPWELLQPVLRILGHCLLGPGNGEEVRDAASAASRSVYACAMHELFPQAILAARSLIRLDVGARKAAVMTTGGAVGSNPNTPSKSKKPEVLLMSK